MAVRGSAGVAEKPKLETGGFMQEKQGRERGRKVGKKEEPGTPKGRAGAPAGPPVLVANCSV